MLKRDILGGAVRIECVPAGKNKFELRPSFVYQYDESFHDIMASGGDFYAFWPNGDSKEGMWSTRRSNIIKVIDDEVLKVYNEAKNSGEFDGSILQPVLMSDARNKLFSREFPDYCKNLEPTSKVQLDNRVCFQNETPKKNEYISKKLQYSLSKGDTPCFDELMGVLYDDDNLNKIKWMIGCIMTGNTRSEIKHFQKFIAIIGEPGSGKSTLLTVLKKLFEGYYEYFAISEVVGKDSFGLETLKSNPLIALNDDADMSQISDYTRLNSIVSREPQSINIKFKNKYTDVISSAIFVCSNYPIMVESQNDGIVRRLIDVYITGNKLPAADYDRCLNGIDFELGAIAYKCINYFNHNKQKYAEYQPVQQLEATSPLYNFFLQNRMEFTYTDEIKKRDIWSAWKSYCEDHNVNTKFKGSYEQFINKIRPYFKTITADGRAFSGFRSEMIAGNAKVQPDNTEQHEPETDDNWIVLKEQPSIFDECSGDYPAQYVTPSGTLTTNWNNCKTTLKDIDTSKLHHVLLPSTKYIFIDFDKKDENGNKCLKLNMDAAKKFPKTYVETSKSGQGLHLHYIWEGGNPEELLRHYNGDKDIEVKVLTGKSSLRRMLTLCNDLPIATISSGLKTQTKGAKKDLDLSIVANENWLRAMIANNLRKKYHPHTAECVNYIGKILSDAYNSGASYDVGELKPLVMAFAAQSSNSAVRCIKAVNNMHFWSQDMAQMHQPGDIPQDMAPVVFNEDDPIFFYDVEIFPNLFLICYKEQGKNKPVHSMINPTPIEVQKFINIGKLVGYNNRDYDNHMIYAASIGYSITDLFNLSRRLIDKETQRDARFGKAYNLSYTDLMIVTQEGKKSLKQWEIDLGIDHVENFYSWKEPLPDNAIEIIVEYCTNDVLATEALWDDPNFQNDWAAHKLLSKMSGLNVNNPRNNMSKAIMFGNNKTPQGDFCYRDLSAPVKTIRPDVREFLETNFPEMMAADHDGSILPFFDKYSFDEKSGKSIIGDIEPGEGGYVYSEPGMYYNVALLDVMSMHPHSAMAECLFGPIFTQRYKDMVYARVAIKHKDWNALKTMLNGVLSEFVDDIQNGKLNAKVLSTALKLAINSVYGLTKAGFANPFKDPRNKDNIVAKRGALFMATLKEEVQKRGYIVAHIKTDSIKIPNADKYIIDFVMEFGKKYGYTFEHEATYDRMCIVNKSTYIAKYATKDWCVNNYGYCPGDIEDHGGMWTATAEQFQQPYVFKTLFSKEDITFDDVRFTKKLTGDAAIYMTDENGFTKPVGKVGNFVPVSIENGGKYLMYKRTDAKTNEIKEGSINGCKGYTFKESLDIDKDNWKNQVDITMYEDLAAKAIDAINKYGDYYEFVR